MYENFILKYWLPILRAQQEFNLIVVGGDGQSTEKFEIPSNYNCEPFGSLQNVLFNNGTMYLPVSRTLGAVDCFLVIDNCLVLFQVTSAAEHSIVKDKMEKLIELAKKETEITAVFIVPYWRTRSYTNRGQTMTRQGKTIRVTGPYKRDVNATLSDAIDALKDKGVDVQSCRHLFTTSKNMSVLKKKLQSILADELRSERGFQDSELEKWSVPRLLANYVSTEGFDAEVKQLLWPIQKSDYDNHFKPNT
jgi:hypothetical protein